MTLHLRDFTPATLRFLAEQPGVYRVYEDNYVVDGRAAMGMLARLRDCPDEHFPGGKWATIQHLEHLIAQAVDESDV